MEPKRVYVKSIYSDGRKEVGCFWAKDTKKFLHEFKEAIDDLEDVQICSESEYCTFQLAGNLQFKMDEFKERFDHNNAGEICNQVNLSFGKN